MVGLDAEVNTLAIWTGLPRHQDEKGRQLIRDFSKVWKSGDQGAATAMVAAFDPGLEGTRTFFHSRIKKGSMDLGDRMS